MLRSLSSSSLYLKLDAGCIYLYCNKVQQFGISSEIYLNTFYDNNIRAIMLEINRNVNLLNYDFNPVIDILKRTF